MSTDIFIYFNIYLFSYAVLTNSSRCFPSCKGSGHVTSGFCGSHIDFTLGISYTGINILPLFPSFSLFLSTFLSVTCMSYIYVLLLLLLLLLLLFVCTGEIDWQSSFMFTGSIVNAESSNFAPEESAALYTTSEVMILSIFNSNEILYDNVGELRNRDCHSQMIFFSEHNLSNSEAKTLTLKYQTLCVHFNPKTYNYSWDGRGRKSQKHCFVLSVFQQVETNQFLLFYFVFSHLVSFF